MGAYRNAYMHIERTRTIPAIPEANRLLVAFENYDRSVQKGEITPRVDDLRKEILRGLEQLALTQQMIRMIASAGLSPWTFRKMREMERDLEGFA